MELLLSNYNPARFNNYRTTQKVWDENLSKAEHVRIASGYISSEALIELKKIIEVNPNPTLDLLIGMHYFDGFTKQQYQATLALSETLRINSRGNIFISNALKFHGKLYSFNDDNHCFAAMIGSSNLSSLATTSNRLYETDYLFSDTKNTKEIDDTIKKLCSKIGTNFVDLPPITDFVTSNDLLKNHYGVNEISHENLIQIWKTKTHISFDIPIKTEAKSNLNIYFGKGRVNQRNFEVPRPWYEVEIIVSKRITHLDNYPQYSQFTVYTDDGWSFRCETNGQNSKNFRSQNDLKILGKWIKGKLEQKGVLEIGKPVTEEVLEKYGKNKMTLTATTNPDIWLIEF